MAISRVMPLSTVYGDRFVGRSSLFLKKDRDFLDDRLEPSNAFVA